MGQRILHLADLHLGFRHEFLMADAETRAREADTVLDRVAEWLLGPNEEQIGAILIAGDLFHTPWPADDTVERVIRALGRLDQAGIDIVTVPGNHDELTYVDGVFRRWGSSWPGTLVTTTSPEVVASFDLDGLAVDVISCAYHQGRNKPSNRWENPIPSAKDPDIRRVGLFHGTIDRIGGVVAEGERAFLLDFERLASWGLDYLALGHIHKRQSFQQDSCLAFYPGPVEGMGFSDPGAPVLTVVDLSKRKATTRPVDARALGIRAREVGVESIDLVKIPDAEALDQRILKDTDPDRPPPILRVELRGHADFDWSKDELKQRLTPRFLLLTIGSTDPAVDLGDWESLASQRTLEGIFVRRLIEKRDESSSTGDERLWAKVAAAGLRALGRGGR